MWLHYLVHYQSIGYGLLEIYIEHNVLSIFFSNVAISFLKVDSGGTPVCGKNGKSLCLSCKCCWYDASTSYTLPTCRASIRIERMQLPDSPCTTRIPRSACTYSWLSRTNYYLK